MTIERARDLDKLKRKIDYIRSEMIMQNGPTRQLEKVIDALVKAENLLDVIIDAEVHGSPSAV